MSDTEKLERAYRVAIEAARAETAHGLDELALIHALEASTTAVRTPPSGANTVDATVVADLSEDDDSRERMMTNIVGVLMAALTTGFFWWMFLTGESEAPVAPPPKTEPVHVAAGPAPVQILLRTADVTVLSDHGATDNPFADLMMNGVAFHVGAEGRIDVAVTAGPEVVVMGPALLRLPRGKDPVLESGTAVFRLPASDSAAPVNVRAGDSTIVGPGATFAAVVRGGSLQQLSTSVGVVEIALGATSVAPAEPAPDTANPAAPGRQAVPAGEIFTRNGAVPTLAATSQFQEPWWTSSREGKPWGTLAITADADGAMVSIGSLQLGPAPLLVRWPSGKTEVRVKAGARPEALVQVDLLAGPVRSVQAKLTGERVDAVPVNPLETKAGWREIAAALVARDCKQVDRLVQKFVETLKEMDERAQAQMRVGECWESTSKPRDAIGAYKKVADSYRGAPTADRAVNEQVRLLAELGLRQDAITVIGRYLERYPTGTHRATLSLKRCELLTGTKKKNDARSCLHSHLKEYAADAQNPEVSFVSSLVAQNANDWKQSAELLRAYLARAPKEGRIEEASRLLVRSLYLGKLPGRNQARDEYVKTYPTSPHAKDIARLK